MTEKQIEAQLRRFANGFPHIKICAAAIMGHGIRRMSERTAYAMAAFWDEYRESGKKVMKFVPASGAASRMFKELYAFMSAPRDTPTADVEKSFFAGIWSFPFFDALDDACIANDGEDTLALMESGRYKNIIANLLEAKGLNYGALPKALLLFHDYPEGARTAMEEHLAEGAQYAQNRDGTVSLHFTVSPEHLPLFAKFAKKKKGRYERRFGVKYDISFSVQEPHTDTIAVDGANVPLRDGAGRLVFRPGGHGALIENLNRLDCDVVFIKNIDNVSPEKADGTAVMRRKALAGLLVNLQEEIFSCVRLIESGDYTQDHIREMICFLQEDLCIRNPELKYLEDAELALYIKRMLMRPLRVCGMVENTGEPGGGPFLAYNPDNIVSPQILERTQIDSSDPAARLALIESTHFNPVDMVCALKDVNGRKYHLPDYADPDTGFIAEKSKDGRALKALELPALWGGSMSGWNTVFVEIPMKMFTPVKTVIDLLRPEHQ